MNSAKSDSGIILALQGMGLVLLTYFLTSILSGWRGLPFLLAIPAGIGLVWLWQRPHWGVLAILTMWLLAYSPALLGIRQLKLTYLTAGVLLVPLAVTILRNREIWVWRVPQVNIFLAIGLLFLISTWWNDLMYPMTLLPEIDVTAVQARKFVTRLVFLIFFLYFIKTRKMIETTVWLVVGVIIAMEIGAIYRLLIHGVSRAHVPFGIATSPTSLPFVCLFGASLLWLYRSHGHAQPWKNILALLALLPLPVLALASGSRTGVLQVATFAILVVKEKGGWSVRKRVSSILFLVFVSIFLLSLVPAANLLRATSFEATHRTGAGKSINARIQIGFAGLEMLASNPVLGVGLGNFRWRHQIIRGDSHGAENAYLDVLAEGGIFVLGLYLLLLYATYRMLRQLEKRGPPDLLWLSKGLKFNLILLMVYSVSDEAFRSDLFYLLIGLTIALFRLQQSQERQLRIQLKSMFPPNPRHPRISEQIELKAKSTLG